MKKNLLGILTALCLFSFVDKVNAACEDKELNDWVESVDVVYMEDINVVGKDGKVIHNKEYLYYLLLDSEKKYDPHGKITMVVRDSISNSKQNGEYLNFFSAYGIGSYTHTKEKSYTITLYGAPDTQCANKKLREITYKVPAYNIYAVTDYCLEYPHDEICESDYNSTDKSQEEIQKIMEENEKEFQKHNMTFWQKTLNFAAESWYFVIIPFLLIAGYYSIRINRAKKKVNN
jgi:hypothetical protein